MHSIQLVMCLSVCLSVWLNIFLTTNDDIFGIKAYLFTDFFPK